jgi:urease accessory protein
MRCADALVAQGWHAELALGFERRGNRTVLATRRHDGPLVVQKPFHPEGPAVCHAIVVHPPAGIAGGDTLSLHASVGERGHALLTTPGAGKWYRSTGAGAEQRVAFDVRSGATLEWLPQESIVYDRAVASLATEVRLDATATFLGWEIVCLGRVASGERFTRGSLLFSTRIASAQVAPCGSSAASWAKQCALPDRGPRSPDTRCSARSYARCISVGKASQACAS